MKRTFIVMIVLFMASALNANPTIKFRETVVDFGTIPRGKIVNIKFEFENIGDKTLTILDVVPSCGCTTASLQKKEFAPGEKGSIPVQFSSSAYQGKVVKTIVVRTNDPLQTSVNLTLTGNVQGERPPQANVQAERLLQPEVKPFLEAIPERLKFEKAKVGKSQSQRFTIKNHGPSEMRILEVGHMPDVHLLFPANSKMIPSQGKLEVEVVLKPLEAGSFRNLLKIRSSDNQNPYLLVKLEAEVE